MQLKLVKKYFVHIKTETKHIILNLILVVLNEVSVSKMISFRDYTVFFNY